MPITQLLRKDIAFEWNQKCEDCFLDLKNQLETILILTILMVTASFVIYSDTFHQGLGCVLMQEGKVIAYTSR